jgi:steroid delta-isomerase-like uncharacterized protein
MGKLSDLYRQAVAASWERGQHALLEKLFHTDYKAHDEAIKRQPGIAGIARFIDEMRGSIDDVHYRVHEQIETGHALATRYTLHGKHTGTLLGVPATNRHFVVGGMSINRVADGKIIEGRVVWDAERLRSQLGGKESRRLGLCDAYLRLADATYVHADRKAFAAVLAPDYRVEDCATGEQRTAEQQWAFAGRLREAHEHIHFEVLETIECGHDVAAYFVFSATAKGSGRRVILNGMSIHRGEPDRLSRGLLVWDRGALEAQVGKL